LKLCKIYVELGCDLKCGFLAPSPDGEGWGEENLNKKKALF